MILQYIVIGFEEFLHIKPALFDIMPHALNMIESSASIKDIIKVSLDALGDRNSDDTENILFKQSELNYKKTLGNSPYGKFQMFLMEAANSIFDVLTKKNQSNE